MKRLVSCIFLILFLISSFAMPLNASCGDCTKGSCAPVSSNRVSDSVLDSGTYAWPMFHQNLRHTGYSNSKAPDTNNTLWSYTTGSYVYSGPVVADGKVFVGSVDHNVYALNEATGTKIWNYDTGGVIGYSNPAVADGMVFISSGSGCCIYALNEVTGTKIWNYTADSFVWSSPTVTDGKVFIGSLDGNLYALNEFTGTKIWNYTTGDGLTCSPTVVDGMVFTGLGGRSVYALNEATGDMIWNYTTGDFVDVSTPAVVDGMVFIGSSDHSVYALNEFTGTKIWSYTTGGEVYSSPAVADGMLFVGSNDCSVYALNEVTGTKIWSYTTGGTIGYSSPAVADGKVFVGSVDHNVYALNEATGTKIWSYNTGGKVYSSPAVADGMLFVGSNDNKVYAFGSQSDLWITGVQPIQAIDFPAGGPLVAGKATGFRISIASSLSQTVSGVYLSWTAESFPFSEGPLTIAPSGITYYTKNVWYPSGPQCGELVFKLGKNVFKWSPYLVWDPGTMKIIFVPVGFWKSQNGGAIDPEISARDLADMCYRSSEFIKGVFPVSSQKFSYTIGNPVSMISNGLDPIAAHEQVIATDKYLERFRQPTMGGFDRVVAVVPSYFSQGTTWHNRWLHINAIGRTLWNGNDKVVWVEEGYYSTVGHELGHSFGLQNGLPGFEDYCTRKGCGYIDGGVYLENQPCMMSAGENYHEWPIRQRICRNHYYDLVARSKNYHDPDVIFVSGTVYDNNTVVLDPFYHFTEGIVDIELNSTGDYSLQFLDTNMELIGQAGFKVTFDPPFNVTFFAFAVPYVPNTARVQVVQNGTILASREITANTPIVSVISPNGGEIFTSGQNVTINWQGSDLDGDGLTYTVLCSSNNGTDWVPIPPDTAETGVSWVIPNDATSGYLIKVIATDGFNVGMRVSESVFTVVRHDMGVSNLQVSRTILGEKYSLAINVTLENEGNFTEIPSVGIYANTTLIHAEAITVTNGESKSIAFSWNTTGFEKGNYTLSACVETVPGEVNLLDNNFTGSVISVTIPGDVNGDFTVDIYDALILAGAYNSVPTSSNWNANADINGDNIVDIYDAILLSSHYGATS